MKELLAVLTRIADSLEKIIDEGLTIENRIEVDLTDLGNSIRPINVRIE